MFIAKRENWFMVMRNKIGTMAWSEQTLKIAENRIEKILPFGANCTRKSR